MRKYGKWILLLALVSVMALLSGCSNTPDTVEDPLSAFGIDAVLPFATAAPEAVQATPTPAPTTDPDSLTTDPSYGQGWKQEGVAGEEEEDDDGWLDDPDEAAATPRPTPRVTPRPAQEQTYERLSYGATGTAVKNLQNRLKKLGYFSGSADGKYGVQTVNAVKLYQSIAGFDQNGVASVALQQELYSAQAPKYTPPSTPAPTAQYVRLEKGDAGERVTRLQNRLKTLGYYTGTVDGSFGVGTVSAVKRFQKALNLDQTGTATVALQTKLFSSSAPKYTAPTPVPAPDEDDTEDYVRLAEGSSGTRVRNLQRRLRDLGYYTGSVDGNFGSGTVGAVKRFQKMLNVSVTGIASASLQRKLFASNAPVYEGDPGEDTSEDEYIILSPGDSGAEVKRLQKRLKTLGYFDGEIGGNYQAKTTDAVKRFQKAVNIKQTGIATSALQARIFADNAPYYEGDVPSEPSGAYVKLVKGDTGDRVLKLQERLTELGYYGGALSGNFNNKTHEAIKLFEKRYGKPQTGVATIPLQKVLFSDDALSYKGGGSGSGGTQDETYVKLQPGDTGAQVKKLQRRMKELGYFEGSIGGNYQKLTTDAVKRFQKQMGVKQSGIASVALQEALFAEDAPHYSASSSSTTTPDPYQSVKRGDTGAAVKTLQDRLLEVGYIRTQNDIKYGTFDRMTMLAVIDAQNARGYDSDGVADTEFLMYLYSDAVWEFALAGYEGG